MADLDHVVNNNIALFPPLFEICNVWHDSLDVVFLSLRCGIFCAFLAFTLGTTQWSLMDLSFYTLAALGRRALWLVGWLAWSVGWGGLEGSEGI